MPVYCFVKMAVSAKVLPVQLFNAVLFKDENIIREAESMLTEKFGMIKWKSRAMPFDITDYYQDEMGTNLQKIFFAFDDLIMPDRLADLKLQSNEIEKIWAKKNKRLVNIDPGYIDHKKVVLASMKYHGNKIYLGSGVSADLNLIYEKGDFKSFDWTFPDFKDGRYKNILLKIREIYKNKLKSRSP